MTNDEILKEARALAERLETPPVHDPRLRVAVDPLDPDYNMVVLAKLARLIEALAANQWKVASPTALRDGEIGNWS